MTHSLHRSGDIESQKKDYVWFMYQTKGINDVDIKPKALEIRIISHASDFNRLLESAKNAKDLNRQLLASYCYHEALRSAGKSIIEKFGTRVFSHSTFVSEIVFQFSTT